VKTVRLDRITHSDADRHVIQHVLDEAPDYAMRVTGLPPDANAGESLLSELPEGMSYKDKFVFSVHFGDKIVGCADMLRGYPVPEKAFLGLLVISEHWQDQGLGAAAYAELESVARGWGCRTIRLGVVLTNEKVFRFWERQGFRKTGEKVAFEAGSVNSEVVLMEKPVAPAPV
jgi:GNAT superfamily N-acetyltransferase